MSKINNFERDTKEYKILSLAEELAFNVSAYYKQFKNNHKDTLVTLYESMLDEFILSNIDKQRIYDYAIEILKYKYKLEVKSMSVYDKLILKRIKK